MCDIHEIRVTSGRGIGPLLEAKDALEVLEQKADRPLALESKALRLAGKLLDLCLKKSTQHVLVKGEEIAREILTSGKALTKMKEIIKAQGGNADVQSSDLIPGEFQHDILSSTLGRITKIDNRHMTTICRILGCPTDKKSGMYLVRKLEEKVDKNDILCTLYSTDKWRMKEAVETIKHISMYTVE
jgi:AMP phosphorylase